MTKAAEYGKTKIFTDKGCEIKDSDENTIAYADRVGNLYCI